MRPPSWAEKSQWSCLSSQYKNTFFNQCFAKRSSCVFQELLDFKLDLDFFIFTILILREISISFLFSILRNQVIKKFGLCLKIVLPTAFIVKQMLALNTCLLGKHLVSQIKQKPKHLYSLCNIIIYRRETFFQLFFHCKE